MTQRNLLLIIFVSAALFLCQCKKNKEGKFLGYINYTETDLKILPYTGNETLVFRDSANIYNITFCNGVRYSAYHLSYADGQPSSLDNPNTSDYWEVERNVYNFNGGIINLNQSSPSSTNQEKIFFIIVGDPNSQTNHDLATIFGSCKFDSGSLIDNPINNNSIHVTEYYDSINIVSNKYYNVYELTCSDTIPQGYNDIITKIFYNTSRGFVGFKSELGRTWYLE